MLQDVLFRFCSADDCYADATSVQSENILDWGEGREDKGMGAGVPLVVACEVTTAFAGGTSAQFKFVTDSDETITNGTVLVETPAIAVATLAKGYKFTIPLPQRIDEDRYCGLVITSAGTNTAGAISAAMIPAPAPSVARLPSTQVSTSNI